MKILHTQESGTHCSSSEFLSVKDKILLVYDALNGLGPTCISDYLLHMENQRQYSVWNQLPENCRSAATRTHFKSRLFSLLLPSIKSNIHINTIIRLKLVFILAYWFSNGCICQVIMGFCCTISTVNAFNFVFHNVLYK